MLTDAGVAHDGDLSVVPHALMVVRVPDIEQYIIVFDAQKHDVDY